MAYDEAAMAQEYGRGAARPIGFAEEDHAPRE